ncbi:calmodulin-A [Drosophila innubila]|uniref:calmodulin-A n=1 Tax=Drosophila innubila TaxID=198719 RepID=UPI00148E61B4|nr:calmodulin-A [Drosophila innubila]
MPTYLTSEQLEELRDVFEKFDANNDGFISHKELRLMLRTVGMEPTEAELYDLIRVVDLDSNSMISFNEYLQFMAHRLRDIESEENLRLAFEAFNRTGYGFFDAHDLRIVMGNFGELLTEQDSAILLSDMDIKNEQRIHLHEFLAYMGSSGSGKVSP